MRSHLNNRRHGFKQLDELCTTVVSDTALFTKVIVISRDEFREHHRRLVTHFDEFNDLLCDVISRIAA